MNKIILVLFLSISIFASEKEDFKNNREILKNIVSILHKRMEKESTESSRRNIEIVLSCFSKISKNPDNKQIYMCLQTKEKFLVN